LALLAQFELDRPIRLLGVRLELAMPHVMPDVMPDVSGVSTGR
jgi:hypothetical protein